MKKGVCNFMKRKGNIDGENAVGVCKLLKTRSERARGIRLEVGKSKGSQETCEHRTGL